MCDVVAGNGSSDFTKSGALGQDLKDENSSLLEGGPLHSVSNDPHAEG